MTFLDVGAFHGLYSIVAAERLGKGGRLIAFEPSQENRNRLVLHLKINRGTSVQVEPSAVSDTDGEATLLFSAFTTKASLRVPGRRDTGRRVRVKTISLDSYLQGARINNVDCMKIDVEAANSPCFAELSASSQSCVRSSSAKYWT